MNEYIQLKDNQGNNIYPNSPQRVLTVVGSSGTLNMYSGYIYLAGLLDSVTLNLYPSSGSDYNVEYFLSFESGTTPTTVTWPSGLVFANSATPPTIVDNAHYEISIRNNLCIVQVFGVNTGGGGGGGSDVDFTITDNTLTPNFGILKYQTYNVVPFSSVPYEQVSGTNVTITLDPGKIYVAGQLTDLDFSLGTNPHSDYLGIYHIRFESGSTATSVTWPSGLLFKDGVTPTIDANKTYEIDIVDNLCVVTFYA